MNRIKSNFSRKFDVLWSLYDVKLHFGKIGSHQIRFFWTNEMTLIRRKDGTHIVMLFVDLEYVFNTRHNWTFCFDATKFWPTIWQKKKNEFLPKKCRPVGDENCLHFAWQRKCKKNWKFGVLWTYLFWYGSIIFFFRFPLCKMLLTTEKIAYNEINRQPYGYA